MLYYIKGSNEGSSDYETDDEQSFYEQFEGEYLTFAIKGILLNFLHHKN